MSEPTIAELIESRIRAAFAEVAETVNDGRIDPRESGDDDTFTPMTIFDAETALLKAWRRYLASPASAGGDKGHDLPL